LPNPFELRELKMKKTVMIVDDEEDIRSTVKTILTKGGYDVLEAESGDDCLVKLKGTKKMPDLILFDIMMPGTPTGEVVKKLKDVKIAFVSVVKVTEAEKENLLKQKNILDFIQKPFEVNDLLARVKKMVA
jgi:response regulator RpfG family c-di-GMP phosphodiesterase